MIGDCPTCHNDDMQRPVTVFVVMPRRCDFVRQRLVLGRLVPAFFHVTPREAWNAKVEWHAGVGTNIDPADYIIVEMDVDYADVDDNGAYRTRAIWTGAIDPQDLLEIIKAERAKSATSVGTLTS